MRKKLAAGLALLLSSGCMATKDYVNGKVAEAEQKVFELQQELAPYRAKFSECFDGKYDFDSRCMNSLTQDMGIKKGIYPIFSNTVIDNPKTKAEDKYFFAKGTCVLLKSGYVLTSRHVLDLSSSKKATELVKKHGKKKSVVLMLNSNSFRLLKTVKMAENHDLALLKPTGKVWPLPGKPFFSKEATIKVKKSDKKKLEPFEPIEAELGKSEELQKGNYLYLVGNPFNLGLQKKRAMLSSIDERVNDIKPASNIYNIDIRVFPGTSGGPVFAVRDGKLELAGIMKSTDYAFSQFVGIDYALEEFKDYLDK